MRRAALIGLSAVACLTLAVPTAAARASVQRLNDFPSVVAVRWEADFPVASLMRANCAFAQRTERPDGSAVEIQSCTLSTEPVMIPAFQGEPPERALVVDIGSCTWISDFSTNELIYSERTHLVVTPSGRVHATSFYPSTPLTCD